MAFTPDLPFPKSAGDPLRSKDWNDLVTETQRLDTAKLERAGDAITGSLSIAGALAVGKAAAGGAVRADFNGPLCINDANLMLRGPTDTNHALGWHGPGKAFAGLEPDGPALYGNAGGLLGTTAGGQRAALTWNQAGQVGLGVPAPGHRLDVGDRARLREGAAGSAGMWLYQNAPATDRAFVGMASDDAVGFWGNGGIGWGLQMEVNQGTVGVRTGGSTGTALWVYAGAAGSSAARTNGLVVTGAATWAGLLYGNVYVGGRVREQNFRSQLRSGNAISTTARNWVDMPNMQMTVVSPEVNNGSTWFQIEVQINGVQSWNDNNNKNVGAYFRLLIDGAQHDFTRHEFHNNGWELRGVRLGTTLRLAAGNHAVTVQWYATAATLTCCFYGDSRTLTAVEL